MTQTAERTKQSYALAYGRRGFRVHPLHNLDGGPCTCGRGVGCQTPGKHPRLAGWQDKAATDAAIIDGWWRQWPDANLGIVTGAGSGIVVLDVDPRNGGDDSLATLEAEHGELPETPEVKTGGGGRHIYFAYPQGQAVPSADIAPGLEIKSDGRQVVAPPSFAHVTGRPYAWDAGRHIADIALAPVPSWLLAMAGGTGQQRNSKAPDLPDRIHDGSRNAMLTSLAGTYRARGLSEDEIFDAIWAVNQRRCDPPLSEVEVKAIAGSVAKYAPSTKIANNASHKNVDHLGNLRVPHGHLGQSDCMLRCLADVELEQVSWLWRGYVPLAKVTVLDGDPDRGKSTLTLALAARVSTGQSMPDGTASDLDGPAGVLLLSAEDGLGDTIRPRLEAAGADLSRISALTDIIRTDEKGNETRYLPTIPGDLDVIEKSIVDIGAKLLVVDPLMAYLDGGVDSHRDQDIRQALAPLAAMAERTEAAVIIVRHLNKLPGGNPLYRGGGSIGIVGAARSGLLVAKDPDDPAGQRRVLASTKHNLAQEPPSLAYHLEEALNGAVRVVWDGPTSQTATTLLAVSTGEEGEAIAEAKTFLADFLAGGPMAAKEVQKAAKEAGIADKTLWRAKAPLGIVSRKDTFTGGWRWQLPDKQTAQDGQENTKITKMANLLVTGELGDLGEEPDGGLPF